MSRVTLGHTGQPLHAGAGLTLAYLLVTAAAVLRVTASLWDGQFLPLVWAAAIAWIAAFLVYLGVCAPLLAKRQERLRMMGVDVDKEKEREAKKKEEKAAAAAAAAAAQDEEDVAEGRERDQSGDDLAPDGRTGRPDVEPTLETLHRAAS